jgi:nitroreductase
MNSDRLKQYLKSRMPRLFLALRGIRRKYESLIEPGIFRPRQLQRWRTGRLLAIMRNDAHRIEKSVYSNRLVDNKYFYTKKREQIVRIIGILEKRGVSLEEPTIRWAHQICDDFTDLEKKFVTPGKMEPRSFMPNESDEFLAFLRDRRSTRVWSTNQPTSEELVRIAYQMIDAGRWAPSSGNRQAWRFAVMVSSEDKSLLYPIKEVHCYSAPIAIFVGMDSDAFVFENTNTCMYVDAGMAMMSMVLLAHRCGLGTVVNHFGKDLIQSRWANRWAFKKFSEKMNIPTNVVPVAIINVGIPEFIPPTPPRALIESLLIAR